MDSVSHKKRVRSDSDELPEFDSPEAKKLREDLLDTLEDSDACTVELDSFIKSFESEILPPERSDSGESRPDLEFLLEASDDELGLPPTTESVELANELVELSESVVNELVELSESLVNESDEFNNSKWFDDSFRYGFEYVNGDVSFNGDCDGEYDEVLDDGLFSYTDITLPM